MHMGVNIASQRLGKTYIDDRDLTEGLFGEELLFLLNSFEDVYNSHLVIDSKFPADNRDSAGTLDNAR